MKPKSILKWIFSFFHFSEPVSQTTTKTKVCKKKSGTKSCKNNDVGWGQFPTIKALLNDLDQLFLDIKKMTPRRDSNAQNMVRKYGPYVSCLQSETTDVISGGTLESYKAYGFPNSLIEYNNSHSKTNKAKDGSDWCEKFVVATRLNKIPLFLPKKGFVYYEVVYVLFDGGEKLKEPVEMHYTIGIDKRTGEVNAMPQNLPKHHSMKGGSYTSFHWRYPDFWDVNAENQDHSPLGLKTHLETLFCLTYNAVMRREYNVNVIVKKGKHRATFSVPNHRWKYFFKDRIKAKTMNGNTRPIFHWVASHKRVTKNGTQNVKTHTRGVRRFLWGAYQIIIVLPNKHGLPQAGFNVAGSRIEDVKNGEKMIDITSGKYNTLIDLYEGNKTIQQARQETSTV